MLQVIQGATSDTLAELHFKWPDAPSDLMARLSAKGPFCRWARTLPARFAFEQIRDGWWRTQIVDPCFWSPDYPGVYRLEIDGQPIVQQETTADLPTEIAVRRFGARGNQLFWNGKRCVLRGQLATNLTDGDHATDTSDTNESLWTTAYRELMLGRIDSRYCPTRAAIATRDGVWLGLRIDAADHWQSQLQQITKSPALILVVLPGSANIDAQELAELAPNVLKVADLTNLDLESAPDWCDAILIDGFALSNVEKPPQDFTKPVLVYSQFTTATAPADIRSRCEQLQARLAPAWTLNGYLSQPITASSST